MKTLSFILAIAALGFFIACEFDEEPFVEKVPEEFTGANIFQCKINGEEFTANRTQATFQTSDFITISGSYTSSPTDLGEGIRLAIRVKEDNVIKVGVHDIYECPEDFCYPWGGGAIILQI